MKRTKKEILARRGFGNNRGNARFIIFSILVLLILAITVKENEDRAGLILERIGFFDSSIDLRVDQLAARVERKIDESRKSVVGGN